MDTIHLGLVDKIPFLNHGKLEGRFISTLNFWHENQWVMYIVVENQVIATRAWPAEGLYFAASAEQKTDFILHFLNFTAQRACSLGLEKPIMGIRDDLFNLGACVAKLKLLQDTREQHKTGVSRMVTTEVEYIYSLCRSIYDLLQEYAQKLWELMKPPEPTKATKNAKRKYPELDSSFAGMALKDGKPREVAEIIAKYSLPLDWAMFYNMQAEFFADIRQFRDNIVHNGSYIGTIYSSEEGFLIRRNKRPFDKMKVWKEEEIQENDVAPLMPAIGSIVLHTMLALESFTNMLEVNWDFPEPIVPGMNLYMRGYFDKELSELLKDALERLETIDLSEVEAPIPEEPLPALSPLIL